MAKHVGTGFTLKLSTAGSTTFGVTVGQVRSISGPSRSADVIDITTFDSTNNYREKAVGFLDGGEVTIGLIYDPGLTSHTELSNMFDGRTTASFQVVYPTTTITVEFSGPISALGQEIPLSDVITADLTVAITGKPVFPTST